MMRDFKVIPAILIALLFFTGGSSSSEAQGPEKRMAAALKRALESSNFAVQRRLAELKDIADEDWQGFGLVKTDEEWRRRLTPERYRAEPEHSGESLDNRDEGALHRRRGRGGAALYPHPARLQRAPV